MADLDPQERAREMARARPARGLPIAPLAKPGARRLPLADAARPIDRRLRPIYAVWEITLACDLACRHCGSRAGRGRPDELTTAEALDLIDQMARLDVKEVTLIGGEAYLRDDWLRGVAGSYRSAIAAMRAVKASGMALSCNTQINRLSMPLLEGILGTVAALGIRGWQIQLTVPMGRAAGATAARAGPDGRRWESRPTAPSRAALRSRRSAGRAATSAMRRSRRSGNEVSRCATCAIARWTISGGTAGLATTPRSAWLAARGRASSRWGGRGTIPSAIIARSRWRETVSASES